MNMSNIITFLNRLIRSFLRDPFQLNRWVRTHHQHKDKSRISIRVRAGSYRWSRNCSGAETSMFVQDMYQGIMPFTHVTTKGSKFTVKLDRGNGLQERMVAAALDSKGYRWDLADAFCDFVRISAQELFTYGRTVYEIVYDTNSVGTRDGFKLVRVHPLSVKQFLGCYYQVIPWWIAKRSRCRAGIKKLPADRILCIDYPKELGGRNQIRRILRRLVALGKEIIPQFHMESLINNENLGFDLEKFVQAKFVEQAQLTRDLGWHQREFTGKRILEYYSVHRHLRDALSKAIVREYILNAVNTALNGAIVHLNGRIVVNGVLTADQIRAEFKRLESGNVSFSELVNRVSVF